MPRGDARGTMEPLMTLREYEVDGLPSMHTMFMEDKDITGYATCMRTVGVWRHWKKMWANKKLKPHMDAWVEELEVWMMADGIKKMRNSQSPAAAKYLVEKGWDKKAGRPSKADINKQARAQALLDNDLADDAARIFVIK
jgi:hypothetical protein